MCFWPGFGLPIVFGNTSPPQVPPGSAPGVPQSPVLTPGAEQLTFSWSVPITGDPASSYTVQYDTDIAFPSPTSVPVPTGTSTVVTSLDYTLTYYFRVLATNGAGSSAYTTQINDSPDRLAAPTNGTFSNITDTEQTVTWDTVTNAVTYEIDVDDAVDFVSPINGYTGLANPSHTETGLSAGTQYWYRIRAVGVQNSLWNLISDSTTGAQSSDITINVTRPITTGVAPLGVLFIGAKGESDLTTSVNTAKHFHELDFEWDFNDPGSGSFSYGNQSSSTVTSRDTGLGPVAAHVYETPASYSPQVTVRDFAGEVKTETLTTIVVTDPDDVYSGTNTICISTTGNFDVAPAGCLEVQTSDWDEIEIHLETANRRVLFRAGESWTSNGHVQPAAGVYVGKYDTGNDPVISGNGGGQDVFTPSGSNRFVDLHFAGLRGPPGWNATAGSDDCFVLGSVEDVVFLRCTVTGFDHAINAYEGIQTTAKLKHIFVHDCDFNGNRNYCVFGAFLESSFQGNRLSQVDVEHVVRLSIVQESVFGHNSIDKGSGSGKHHLTFRGPLFDGAGPDGFWPTGEYSQNYVVCDNTVECTQESGTGAPPTQSVQIQSQTDAKDERHRNYLFTRNYIYGNVWNDTSSSPQVGLIANGQDATIQANIVDISNFRFTRGVEIDRRSATQQVPDNVNVLYNTFYASTTATGVPDAIRNDGQNTIMRGNISYLVGSGDMFDDDQSATSTKAHNTGDFGAENPQTDPDFSGTVGGSDATAYRLNTGTYGENHSAALTVTKRNYRDYSGALRSTTTPDAGAWEV